MESLEKYRVALDHEDHVLSRIIVEKSSEFQATLYLAFIDFEKAFGCLDEKKTGKPWSLLGSHVKLLTLSKFSLRTPPVKWSTAAVYQNLSTLRGVKQWCILFPIIFLMVLILRRILGSRCFRTVLFPLSLRREVWLFFFLVCPSILRPILRTSASSTHCASNGNDVRYIVVGKVRNHTSCIYFCRILFVVRTIMNFGVYCVQDKNTTYGIL